MLTKLVDTKLGKFYAELVQNFQKGAVNTLINMAEPGNTEAPIESGKQLQKEPSLIKSPSVVPSEPTSHFDVSGRGSERTMGGTLTGDQVGPLNPEDIAQFAARGWSVEDLKQFVEWGWSVEDLKQWVVEAGEEEFARLTQMVRQDEERRRNLGGGETRPAQAEAAGGGGGDIPEILVGPQPERGPEWETNPERGRWLVEEIVRLRTTMTYEQRYALRDPEGRPYLEWLYLEFKDYVDKICIERNMRDPWDPYVRDAEGKARKYKQNEAGAMVETVDDDPDGHPQFKEIAESPLLLTQDEEGIYHLERSALDERSQAEQDEYEEMLKKKPEGLPLARKADGTWDVDAEGRPKIRSLDDLSKTYDRLLTLQPAEREQLFKDMAKYFEQAELLGLFKGVNPLLRSIRDDLLSGSDKIQIREQMDRKLKWAAEIARAKFRRIQGGRPEFEAMVTDDGKSGVWDLYIKLAADRFSAVLDKEPQRKYEAGEFRLNQEAIADEDKETYWMVGHYPKYYEITARTPEQFLRAKDSFLRMIRAGTLAKSAETLYEHINNFKDVYGARGTEAANVGTVSYEFIRDQRLELEGQLFAFVANYAIETYNEKVWKDSMTAMARDEGPERWYRLFRSGDGQVGAFTYLFDQVGQGALMEIFNNPVGNRGELDIIAQHCLQDQIRQMAIEWGMGVALKTYDPTDTSLTGETIEAKVKRAAALERIQAAIRSGKTVEDLSPRDQEIYKAYRVNLERLGLHQPGESLEGLYEGFDDGSAHIANYRLFTNFGLDGPGALSAEDLDKLPPDLRRSVELGRIQEQLIDIRARIRAGELKLYRKGQIAEDFLSEEDGKLYKDACAKAEGSFDIAFQMQGASGEKVRRGRGFLYVERNPHLQAYRAVAERSRRIEWLLDQIGNGKKLEEFGEEVRQFAKSLTEEEKQLTCGGVYGIDSGKFSAEQRQSIEIGWMMSSMKRHRRLDSFTEEQQALYTGLREDEKQVYTDNVPVYLAEKFVQYAVTRTRVQFANAEAVDRAAAIAKAREDAVAQFKKRGWQAELKMPKILFDEEGEVVGVDAEHPETIDFQSAVKHIYSRYTTHTYWGYQGENRHMILRTDLYAAAKRIRAGLSRPEDEDILATQLLLIDPTLKRLTGYRDPKERALGRNNEEDDVEIRFFQAAVEESFSNHARINRALFEAFLPADGYRGEMHAGFKFEDWGGTMRFVMGIKELCATQPERFDRRGISLIAMTPVYVDSMAALWGQDGVMGAVSMFADKIGDIGHQKMVSQFGITKFITLIDDGVRLYDALIGTVVDQEGVHKEGLYMKPTNNNEFLHAFARFENQIKSDPKQQLEFLKALRESFGRLEAVLKIMRPMYSDHRNAGGALNLEAIDLFLDTGEFNPDIEKNQKTYMNTGTSRHFENEFYESFTKWLLSEWPGGGGEIYPDELIWNKFILEQFRIYVGSEATKESTKTFKQWFFEKAGL